MLMFDMFMTPLKPDLCFRWFSMQKSVQSLQKTLKPDIQKSDFNIWLVLNK